MQSDSVRSPAKQSYLDFELEIGPGSGREYPVAVIRSPAGEARETMRFPFDELALESRLDKLQIALLRSGGMRRKAPSAEEQAVQDLGRALFNSLLTGEVRARYDVSQREAAQQGKGLRFKLRIQSPDLATLPWEFLYDPRQAEYVCLSRNTPMVRYLELPQPILPLTVAPPLRILGLIAGPAGLPALDVTNEKQRVEKATEELRGRGMVDLTWLDGQTWRHLQRAMRGGPWHIFHFIGHGGFDAQADEGLIVLADEQEQPHHLRATHLGRLLADHRSLRLVVLNACEGAKGSTRDIFSSTASILLQRGIPAVLAMQYEITDRAAVEFSRSFYEALADEMPVDAAVAEARKAVSLAMANTVEWGIPVLYMHSPDGILFNLHVRDRPQQEARRQAEQTQQETERKAREPDRQTQLVAEKAEAEQLEQERTGKEAKRQTHQKNVREKILAVWNWWRQLPPVVQFWPLSLLIGVIGLWLLISGGRGLPFPPAPTMPVTPVPGTPPLRPATRISPENANRVVELARWGKGTINQIALSTDGQSLAVASSPGVYLYNATTLSQTHFIETDTGVRSIAFSANGAFLAIGLENNSLQLWNISGRQLMYSRAVTGWVESVVFSPSGTILASGSGDGVIRLWRSADGMLVRTLDGHAGSVRSMAFSPDGTTLALGADEGAVQLWRVSDGAFQLSLVGLTSYVFSVAFSPDGKMLAAGAADSTIQLWRLPEGETLHTLKGHTDWVNSVAFSPDGKLIVSGSADSTVRTWQTLTGEPLRTLKGHTSWVQSVTFLSDGASVASGSDDGTVRIWQVSGNVPSRTLEGYTSAVYCIAFSPDGAMLASAGEDSKVRLWRISDGVLLRILAGHTSWVYDVAFSPDGTILASASRDYTVRLWRVSDGALLHVLRGHTWLANSVGFSPDGAIVGSGSWDGTARLWRVEDGALIRTIETSRRGDGVSITFSPDGTVLATAARNQPVRLWQIADGMLLRTLENTGNGMRTVTFGLDWKILASASSDGTIMLWQVSDGALLQTLQGYATRANGVGFSPDGTLLVSGGQDNAVRLWSVSDGMLLSTLNGHWGYVNRAAFSPDGMILASASSDGTVRLWGVR